MFGLGIVCPRCGITYFLNHICPITDPHRWVIKYGEQPHKCPVCDGTGKVDNVPVISSTVPDRVACNACNGSGVLWR